MRSILKFCFSAYLLLCFTGVQAQIVYDFPALNGRVRSLAEDADYVYIGGEFTGASDYNQANKGMLVVSATSTGLVDNGFPAFNGSVNAIVDDGNGGWFIGGGFTKVGTFTRNRIVHILADKTVDPVWNPNADDYVNSLILSGTELYVGGYFNNIGGQFRNAVARLSTTGTGAADAWNPNAGSLGNVYSLALSGTDLYIGGSFTTSGGLARNNIAKLTTTGTGATDVAWNPNANSIVNSIALSGTDLFVGGNFTTIGGQSRNRIAKLITTGSGIADAVWNPSASNTVNSLALSGTDLYVGGSFTSIGGQSRNRIAKLGTTGTGTADAVWNPGANSDVYSLIISGTDLYLSGTFTAIGGQNRKGFARLITTGSGNADAVWGSNGYSLSGSCNSILVSGDLVLFGATGFIAANPITGSLLRISKNTNSIDLAWNPNADGFVYSLTVSGTDLYVGGDFTNIGGQARNRIAKLSTTGTGTADAAWNPNADNSVNCLTVLGTDLFVGGLFTTIGGQTRGRIAKLSTTGAGTADATWNPSGNGNVRAISIFGTDLYVGGDFTTIGGQTRGRIAKLSTMGVGTADATWNPNASSGSITSIIISGSDLFVGGSFTGIFGGQLRDRIAKISTTGTGTADATWNPGPNLTIRGMALSGTDLYVAGEFTSIGGQFRNYIAKLGTMGTGSADAGWNAEIFGSPAAIFSILQSGSNVYFGGTFTSLKGITVSNFAVVPTLLKISQTISFSSLSTRFLGGSAFTLFATGGASGNPVTYTSSNPAVATISGTTVTIVGVGTTTITASQAGNGSYNAAVDVAQILTVDKGNQSISFFLGSNSSKTFGDAPFTLSGTASSGLPVTYTSSNPAVVTVSGNTVTITGAGTSIITASQLGNASYNAATNVGQTLAVNKINQTVTFVLGANDTKNVGDAPFVLSATGGASGNPITFTSSNPAVATVTGNTVTIVGVGTATITASQLGNATYNAAANIGQTLTVNKINQTVTFVLGANDSKTFGDASFALTGTASSGLTVGYTSFNPAVATISGNTVTIVGAGTSTIIASQAGNANFNAAIYAQILTVNKATQTITFSLGANAVKYTGDAPFTLSAMGGVSGNPLIYNSSNPAVATISGNTVAIIGAGRTTITASQAGNANYNDADNVTQTLTVGLITALENLEKTDILVYPNPATDLLTIDIGDAKDCSIAIIDSEGKLVSSGISTQGNGLISISVSQLPAGIYTLQISKKGETTNKRFVKQ